MVAASRHKDLTPQRVTTREGAPTQCVAIGTVRSNDRFVADPARERTPMLVNQYAIEIPGIDRPGGAAIRRSNLGIHLVSRIGAPLALIGEAPSARGARFSRIAFTAERSPSPEHRTSWAGLAPDGSTEHSATILRGILGSSASTRDECSSGTSFRSTPPAPVPLRDRPPTSAERKHGARWLERFVALMRPGLAVVSRRAPAAEGRTRDRPVWAPSARVRDRGSRHARPAPCPAGPRGPGAPTPTPPHTPARSPS